MRPHDLDQFLAPDNARLLESHHSPWRTLYSPVDRVHDAMLAVIQAATTSIQLCMYGFDDAALVKALLVFLAHAPSVKKLQITLDLSQSLSGYTESRMLTPTTWPFPSTPALPTSIPPDPRFSFAVGTASSGHQTIMHMKHMVVDPELPSAITMHGSTNWSISGETRQDNEATFIFDSAHASRCGQHMDVVHATLLAQGHVVSDGPTSKALTSSAPDQPMPTDDVTEQL